MHHARPILAVIAASMFAFVAPAFGHGAASREKPKAFDSLKVEEMPFGRAGNPKNVNRTIRIGMHDTMRFVAGVAPRGDVQPGTPPHAMPADLVVKKGTNRLPGLATPGPESRMRMSRVSDVTVQ